MTSFQQSDTGIRGLWLDPRTKLLLTLVVGTVTIMGGNSPVMEILKFAVAAAPVVLLLTAGRVRQAFLCLCAYSTSIAMAHLVLPLLSGVPSLLLSAVCVVFSRFMPGILAAWYMLSTTTVSEFMAAMQRMHISQKITIPLSVVFRFAPTVKEEYASIGDAMRMRGVAFGGGKVSAMLEYRLVPMMVCSVKIGEELSAAALTRGLGAPGSRTSIFKVGFRLADYFLLLFCTAAIALLVLNKLGVV